MRTRRPSSSCIVTVESEVSHVHTSPLKDCIPVADVEELVAHPVSITAVTTAIRIRMAHLRRSKRYKRDASG
jgi:hypothetical protein